ncbi:unnamed protein product, partial [Prorocentrum cordatum]
AREPLDLMWENMDFPPRRAFNARMCTRILTVVLVVAVLVGIIRLRSVPLAHALSPPANKVWSIYNSTSCFELSDLKFYSDTHCTQELTNYTCVDPDSPGLSTTACQSMLTSFESASCPGANGNAYGVAVKFDEDTTVNCIAATLGPATTADFIQFEACDDSFVGGNLKNSEWEDNPQCTLLRPIDLPEDTTGTGGQTMVVERITDLETSCSRFDDTTEDAEQVLDRVESRGYTLVTEVAFEPRLSCFCDAKRQDSGPFWAWQSVAEDPSAEHEVCEDWLQVYRGKIWQSTLAGIVVVFANQLLKAIFGVIDKIKVFKSRTPPESSGDAWVPPEACGRIWSDGANWDQSRFQDNLSHEDLPALAFWDQDVFAAHAPRTQLQTGSMTNMCFTQASCAFPRKLDAREAGQQQEQT